MSYIFSSLLAFIAGNSRRNDRVEIELKHLVKSSKIIFLIGVFGVLFTGESVGQCNNTTAWLTNNAPTAGNSLSLTTCLFGGEYTTVTAVAASSFYTATSSVGTDFITIREGTPGGTVIASGTTPLNWTSTVAGTYYIHCNTNSGCGSESVCRTITLSALNLPCSGTPNAGTAAITSTTGCTGQNFTLSATGISSGSGLTFQWQSGPSASGPWTNIPSGTTSSFATSVASAGTTFYQLISTCAGVSSTSSTVSYTASACVIMPTSGVTYITSCGTTIYDSGGSGADYTNNESGTVIIRPSSMWDIVTVTGTCTLRNNDFLSIDEGEDSNTGTFYTQFTGTAVDQVVNYSAQGPGVPLSLHFLSNGNNVNPGFALTVSCTCAKPTAITMTTVDAPCGGTGSVTVTSATPTRYQPWIMTTNENNTLPALSWLPTAPATNAWISGSANMQAANNNQVELTSATNSLNGALVYESFGQNRSIIDAWFDLYAGGGGSADGAAFSYGPGIANTSPTGSNYETGVGTGLWLSFDSYNSGAAFPNCNGTNYQNIYLIYNSTVVACYTNYNYSSWRNNQCPVNLFVSSTGLAYVDLYANGVITTIFNGVQLPPGYVSANKSTWRAAFTARTGGVNDQHRIDNVNIYHNTELEYSINNITWQSSATFSGLTSGNYTMYVRYKGNTSCSYSQPFSIFAPTPSTAPTSITGTSTICTGSSTTLTTAGGTLGTESEDVWYEGACPTECYKQEWLTQPFPSFANMTVNSVSNGVLNVTSISNDPMLDMSGLGSFDPTSCRYVNIRYRVTSGTASNVEIFFYNTANPAATGGQTGFGNLISDNTWRTVSVDMWADPEYQTGGNITGWRFDWATASGVTMDIDFIALSNSPIFATGTSITVSPTVNTTYFTLKQGPCNTTSCVSQLVSITQPPTTATVGADQTICGLTTAALGGNTPAIGTGTWAIVSGGTGTFSNASSPSSTFTASTSGVYVLSWTITNAPCTASSANVTVTLYANPTTATVGANQTICSTLTSNALGGNTPTVGTGAWSIVSGGTGTFSDAASPSSTFTATATGTYVLRWTITNGTCPISTADITVLFAVTPTAGITGTNTFCSGSNTTLTASGGATYAWADGSGTSFGTNAISNTITAAGTYTVTVTSADGCTATASQVISVTPNVTPTFTQIQAQCQNTAAPVLATSSTNSPAITGTWSPLTISTTTVGTATYTFTPTAGICATTATMSISVVSCAQIAPCDILVYRIESGAATPTNSAPISLLEFDPAFTSASSPALVNAPTTNGNLLTQEAGNTANSPLTGYMNTYNGVTAIPGYRDAAGTSVTASDNEGTNIINANQSTTLINHSVFTNGGSFYRAVVPVDGTRFYMLGIGNNAPSSGIFYYNGTSIVTIYTDGTAFTNPIRNIEIFNGQLYCSRISTAANSPYIYAVGTGLPETTTTTLTGVANVAATTARPNDFSISPDGTTMYVADNATLSSTGITKLVKSANGGLFVKVGTVFSTSNASVANVKYDLGLTVDWSSTPVKIFYTAATSPSSTAATYLHSITESAGIGVSSTTWPASSAAVNYYLSTSNSCTSCKYAGVDFAPTIATSVSSNGGCIGNPITVTASALQAGVGTLTYNWYKYTSSAVYVDYLGATLVTATDGTISNGGATFTPLLAGSYFCEISGTCAKFRTQRLVVTTPPVVGTITPNACSGSTATVPITASGALPGYNISWTGTASDSPVGTEIATSGGSYTTPALGSGTYTFTVTASNGCATIAPAVTIACGCTPPAAPTATVTQPTCAVSTGTITVTAPANGATITYTVTGTSPVVAAVTNATGVFSGLASGTYDVTATDATCVSTATPYTINIAPVVPSAPVIGTITQPTCAISTGSVDLSGLPASGTWTVTGSPSGSLTGTGTTGTVTGLTAGTTYTFTVLNADGCTSSASTNAVINGIPSAPSAPVIGTITQPTCAVATGSVDLSGLPSSGTWTVTGSPSGSLTGTGTTGTVTGLTAGTTYTFTVTDANGCTSIASANAILTAQPSGPSAPVIGTITQATCTIATGSVDLSGLPSSGTWTVTGSPSGSLTGTGTTGTVTGLTAGTTYTFTVTDANGCTSSASSNAILNAQPSAPTAPVIGTLTQPTCTVATGSIDLSGLPSSGTWTVTGSPSGSLTGTGTTGTVTGLTAGTTYTFTVTDASGCTSIASSNAILIAQPTTPTAPTIGTITQATCTVSTGSVDLSGLPSSGTWTVTGSPSGSLTGTGTTGTVTGLTAGTTYTFTVTNASGCTSSASANAILTAQPSGPSAPIIGTITQATCAVATGSVDLSGLPSSGTWTVTGSPSGSLTGTGTTGTTGTVTGLTAGTTYTFTVTDANGCTSSASASAILTAQPSGPSAPVIGTITQATCAVATGSVDLSGLPSSGTWTVTGSPSGSLTGTGTTGTVTGLTAGTTYTFTVTDANGCTSSASANAVLIAQPTTPSAPVIGTITQPTCTVATGSVALSGLPSSGTWTVTGSPSGSLTGTGTTGTVTGLTAGTTYTFTVTNASGCTSSASANAILTAQPSGPGSPIIGAITQPTCSVATGSVDFSGLPSSGTWTVTGSPSGSLTGTGTTGTISGLTDGITYTFTVTDASGCISVASSNAVINAQPPVPSPVTLDLIQPTCTDLGVIKVLIPAVGPGITFTVTGTNPVVAAVTSSNAIFSDITPGVYSVSASNGTCSTTAVTCTINPQPSTPTISGTASTCINSTTQLTGSPTAAASSPWTSSNTGVATVSNTGLVTGVDAGTTTITYTNTDGCSATVTVTISDILDWANLQSPGSGTICVGGTFDIYGQLYNTGTVNTTINASAATGVTVEFGYNSSNTNPNTWTNWSSATFNPSGGGTNNDEYMGTFTGLPTGTYYYAFRYQINGCGWQYGGYSNGGGGFWNGTSNVSGVLTVNAAPSILFISPP